MSSVRFIGSNAREPDPRRDGAETRQGRIFSARDPGRILGRLKFEVSFFLLLVATFAAVQYQHLIVDQKIFFTPTSGNFTPYHYDDTNNQGSSTVVADAKLPLKWGCELRAGFAFPYCGYGLMFDAVKSGQGMDLSGFRSLRITGAYDGPSEKLRLIFKDEDSRYGSAGADDSTKPNEIEVPIHRGTQDVVVGIKDVLVPQWWTAKYKLPPELSGPRFKNITAIEIQPADGKLGRHEFRLDSITLEGSYVSQASWYLIILGLWVVLTGLFLFYRAMSLRREYESRHRAQLAESQQLEIARDQAEKARLAAESASRAKSEFLANMSHELRTPLNAILGYAQLLDRAGLNEQHGAAVRTIHRSGQHLLMLITDILDLSKIEAGKLEICALPIDISSCIGGVVDMIRIRAEEKGLSFAATLPDDLPAYVTGDEKRLRQILINLLSNAVRYTPRGEVKLSVTMRPRKRGPDHIRFEVSDTGIGIASDQQELIFQPFEQAGDAQRRAGGTGLGLSISAKLVELMGSKLSVDSRLGEGSRFWFDLQLKAADPIAIVPHVRTEIRFGGEPRKILVVDDTEANRRLLWDMLALLGLEPSEARNGAEALSAAQADRPDLILMDLRMPVMDGFEAMRRIRAIDRLADVPIIALSASVTAEVEAESRAAGADGFLAKPIDQDLLAETIAAHLGDDRELARPSSTGILTAPPTEQIEILLKLARAGNMRAIKSQARHILELDERYASFAGRLEELARAYQSPAILDLIEQCQRREAA